MNIFKKGSVKIKNKSIDGLNKIKKLPKWMILLIILGIILVLGLGGYFISSAVLNKNEKTPSNEYTVSKGNVQVTITGSGSIEPNDQYNITPLVKGEILSSDFEEGDMIKEGDILYVIDSSDQESTMKRAKNSLKQAQSTYDTALENHEGISTKATVSGIVTAVYVDEGDNVGANTKIMDVINNENMVLTIPFISQDADKISIGQIATVNIEGSYYKTTGSVKYIGSGTTLNSEGVQVKTVEIKVKNPGAIEAGDKATAIVGNVACNAAGTFKNSESVTILSEGSGEVLYQPVRVGDKVTKGQVVMKVDSKSADRELENAEINLENAQISYDNTLDQMENYTITAPISGTVIQKNSKAGDTLDNTNSSVTMAVIADMSRMTFDISIDELDIKKLKVAQKATITADAFEDEVFSGTVDYISVIGTTQNGVTTYPVTIVLDDAKDLMPGMNVDAKIIVEESTDTLIVPVDAVQRNNIVYVKDDGKAPKENNEEKDDEKSKMMFKAPEGYKVVNVTLGINDDSFIEILSGLKEGDIVYVQTRASSSSSEMQFPGMHGRMGGGMPSGGFSGGMPGGGMPSGMGGGMQ